jgi:hypothetical protein
VLTWIVPIRWVQGLVPFELGNHRLGYGAIYLALIVLSFLWVGNARVPIIGLLVGPVLVPVLAVTAVAQALIGVPDGVNKFFRKGAEPAANFGPAITGLKKDKSEHVLSLPG